MGINCFVEVGCKQRVKNRWVNLDYYDFPQSLQYYSDVAVPYFLLAALLLSRVKYLLQVFRFR